MVEQQSVLDKWFLKQDVINQLLESGQDSEDAHRFANRIMPVVEAEESEYQSLEDPFDRSVALVLSLVKEQELNPWDIDLSAFLKVFTKRVRNESEKLNLPACGRLIRMAWEVLNQQAIVLFDRVQNMDSQDEWEEEIDFGWEAEYDDEDYVFTTKVLDGGADNALSLIFDERVRRDEGRPVTLGELLSAFKDAADDAEELRLREQNRIAHQEELGDYLKNVGSRMHNEDLEGDIDRCWRALQLACQKENSAKVPVKSVMNELTTILENDGIEVRFDYDEEAKVSSFIAGLFLTHRGFASITQDEVPYGDIMIEDLWPNNHSFNGIAKLIEENKKSESGDYEDEDWGSVQFAKKRAEKLRKIEEKHAREQGQKETNDLEEVLENHEWLVE